MLGGTFLFSGFVKVADPMGMVHKLHAYAEVLKLPFSDFSLMLKVISVGLGTLEFVLGVYLLLRLRRRFATRATLAFMSVFTLLTAWIYVENPVSDCGCFGDALILTNGQTLAKNVVLLAAAVYMVFTPVRLRRVISERNGWLLSIYSWG